MAPKIDITFDKNVYKPDETVKGTVRIITEEDLKIRSIDARYRGKAHNRWYDYIYKYYHDKDEYYMKIQKQLWPAGQKSSSGETIKAGEHEYKFEFDIPKNSPSSFEDKSGYGWLRYTVFITLDRPNSLDYESCAAFTVVADADLKEDEQARQPPSVEKTKKIGIFSRDPVNVTLKCDKGGYVPGEKIKITVDVDNSSDKKIEKVKYTLNQKVKFEGSAFGATEKAKHTLASFQHMVQSPEMKQQHLTGELIVPSVPPSDLPNCSIIGIDYSVQAEVTCGSTISIKTPIRIGTKRLASMDDDYQSADAPPTYLESMFGAVDISEKKDDEASLIGQHSYTPMYPYLNFANQGQK